jgi:hypothetical protein
MENGDLDFMELGAEEYVKKTSPAQNGVKKF